MKSRDLERIYDLKRLFDKQLDKTDSKLPLAERMAQAAKLLDKRLKTDGWRQEAANSDVELVQVEVLSDKPLSAPELKSLYKRVAKLLDAEGLSLKSDSYIEDRLEKPTLKEAVTKKVAKPKQDDDYEDDEQSCDCYECTPCDCPACNPCDCPECRKQSFLDKVSKLLDDTL